MFGQPSGAEVNKGVLNQYVVSKLSAANTSYWVFHKRGESAISILIAELKKAKKADDVLLRAVGDLIVNHMLSDQEWSLIPDQQADENHVHVLDNASKKVLLHEAVKLAKGSCLLGVETNNVA